MLSALYVLSHLIFTISLYYYCVLRFGNWAFLDGDGLSKIVGSIIQTKVCLTLMPKVVTVK